MTTPDSSNADAVRRYLARGWSVLPLRARDKRPLVAWEHWQTERPPPDQIEAWFDRWPDANVGIVTGAISNLLVLDVDSEHGGYASLDSLELRHGALPATVEAITGGGGRHYYFAHPGDQIRNRTGLAPGVDLRGDGGYIVAPPSIHPNGRPYAWANGRSPEDVAVAQPPHWIWRLHGPAHPRRTIGDWRRLVREGVPEGERNATIASLAGHLLRREVDAEVVLELLLAWNRMRCRPPLEDAEVSRVVSSIARLHAAEEGL